MLNRRRAWVADRARRIGGLKGNYLWASSGDMMVNGGGDALIKEIICMRCRGMGFGKRIHMLIKNNMPAHNNFPR